jgi:norsolorinic acid ketoreductase
MTWLISTRWVSSFSSTDVVQYDVSVRLTCIEGPLRLFQATRTLLEKGKNPRFVLIGTPIASISAMEKSPFPMFAYGASKAVAHYLTRKIHCESPGLTAFVVDPG